MKQLGQAAGFGPFHSPRGHIGSMFLSHSHVTLWSKRHSDNEPYARFRCYLSTACKDSMHAGMLLDEHQLRLLPCKRPSCGPSMPQKVTLAHLHSWLSSDGSDHFGWVLKMASCKGALSFTSSRTTSRPLHMAGHLPYGTGSGSDSMPSPPMTSSQAFRFRPTFSKTTRDHGPFECCQTKGLPTSCSVRFSLSFSRAPCFLAGARICWDLHRPRDLS